MDSDQIVDVVRQALREDLGRGDATSEALVGPTRRATGFFLVKTECVLAGLAVAGAVFLYLDPHAHIRPEAQDGDRLKPGQRFAVVEGHARALLKGERVALNFLQRMSGIATMTRRAVDQVQGTRTQILDTRKTVPL